MINPPMTLEEAKRRRYGREPWRSRHCDEQCSYEVYRWLATEQCLRGPGHGPGGLYCKQHARIVERYVERRREAEERNGARPDLAGEGGE